MKIEKIVKSRAKKAKVGCLKNCICALKTSNMAPILSKSLKENSKALCAMHYAAEGDIQKIRCQKFDDF